jgi:hypothetical protein
MSFAPLLHHHELGKCWSSPQGDTRYLPILKCAHSSLEEWCVEQGWHKTNYITDPAPKNARYFIVLRDPLDRWCSGIDMYLISQNLAWQSISDAMWNLMLNQLVFDAHTIPQNSVMWNLPLNQITAFDMHAQLQTQLGSWLQQRGHTLTIKTSLKHNQWSEHPRLGQLVVSGEWPHFLQMYHRDYWLRHWLLGSPIPRGVLDDTQPV